jgi:hypothetical protein
MDCDSHISNLFKESMDALYLRKIVYSGLFDCMIQIYPYSHYGLLCCLPPLSEIFLHNSSMLGSVYRDGKILTSNIRSYPLFAFPPLDLHTQISQIQRELNQTTCIFFKFGPWISLTTIPVEIYQLQFLLSH